MSWIEWYNRLAKRSRTPAPGTIGQIWQILYGTQAAFVSADGYNHYLGLNTWESPGGFRKQANYNWK